VAAGAIGLAAAGLLGGCSAQSWAATETESTDFALTGTDVTITTGSGDLVITPGNVDRVQVTRKVKGAEAQWELKAGLVSADGGTTDLIELRHNCKTTIGNCAVSYEVTVPTGVTVHLSTDSGNVDASGFADGLAIKTTHGDIAVSHLTCAVGIITDSGNADLDDIQGNVEATATTGDMVINNVAADHVTVSTTSGNVTLNSVQADVAVTTTTGDISGTDVTGDSFAAVATSGNVTTSGLGAATVAAGTTTGDINLTLTSVPSTLAVKSDTSTITLAVPQANYAVDLDSPHGDVTSAIPNTAGASNTITASSDSGDISLHWAG
jgi:DUF4097 and DUF4098 domain-containing protein YvlB